MTINKYEDRKLKTSELYDYIVQFMDEHHYAPSHRDMVAGTRLTSTSGASLHLAHLEQEGRLTIGRVAPDHQGSRAITLNRRAVYFTPEEWIAIDNAWGEDYHMGILEAARQMRFATT